MKSCGWRCSGWDKPVPASWKSAGSGTGAPLPRSGPRDWPISAACNGHLQRRFPAYVASRLTTSIDLERSFGPIYARGLLRRGQSGFAVLGVNPQETQSSIDAALTFGILWLDVCREAQAGKMVVDGLKLFLPSGTSALTRERMAHLHPDAAKWQLYELENREDHLKEIDVSDGGNVRTRLVHWTDEASARERFAEAIRTVREVMPEAEIALLSPAEIAFRCHGLEFARARLAHQPGSLRSTAEIVFGVAAEERVLGEKNAAIFRQLVHSVGEVRHAEGPRDHVLWRLHPERWLESLVAQDVGAVDERLDNDCLYSQVPAFSASDRAMIDVLTTTREGRLAVVELKADEDIHLPLQGLDYWSRVAWHHARGEFQRFGYFPGRPLSSELPLLFLVAPSLRVHPATDILLRYISPEIQWTLVGLDERWRNGVRAVFRKRPGQSAEEHRKNRLPKSRLILILQARLPADVAHPPVGPGDMRCGRPPARLRAGWFGRLPRGCAHTNPSLDSRPGPAST